MSWYPPDVLPGIEQPCQFCHAATRGRMNGLPLCRECWGDPLALAGHKSGQEQPAGLPEQAQAPEATP